MLSAYFNNYGYTVIQAANNTDTTFIKETISRAQNESDVIVI